MAFVDRMATDRTIASMSFIFFSGALGERTNADGPVQQRYYCVTVVMSLVSSLVRILVRDC